VAGVSAVEESMMLWSDVVELSGGGGGGVPSGVEDGMVVSTGSGTVIGVELPVGAVVVDDSGALSEEVVVELLPSVELPNSSLAAEDVAMVSGVDVELINGTPLEM
jgi:hypothetical protein